MPAYAPELGSGTTNGRGIKVVATATAGTTLHTCVTGTNHLDEVWVWAWNSDTASRLLTIECGGVTDPDDIIEQTIPAQSGLVLVVPGMRMNNGVEVAAFASAANVVVCRVNVNRIINVEDAS